MRFINDIIKPFIRTARSSTLVVLGLLLSLSAGAQGSWMGEILWRAWIKWCR